MFAFSTTIARHCFALLCLRLHSIFTSSPARSASTRTAISSRLVHLHLIDIGLCVLFGSCSSRTYPHCTSATCKCDSQIALKFSISARLDPVLKKQKRHRRSSRRVHTRPLAGFSAPPSDPRSLARSLLRWLGILSAPFSLWRKRPRRPLEFCRHSSRRTHRCTSNQRQYTPRG
ncbi:hypothetical protein BCV70DRAFT_113000 [Testicularia cyperi]|uniref:Secreted protein n=1 Tax=Testicularia cyperi TaxID=1882483 RepID=A0A317XPI1_9BASI|nr:hypothetical protein BCV70DRAFT_113000 [Testicularia cyperi]